MPRSTASATIRMAMDITTRSKSRSAVQSIRVRAWFVIWLIWIALCSSEILERFDLQNLNTLPEFAENVPTTENLCIAIYDILQRGFKHAHLQKVRFEETMMNSFEYWGENQPIE